jgi:TorA maturation chaperone TorD
VSADAAVAEALGRAAVYTTLATAFDYPTPERVERLRMLTSAAEGAAGIDREARAALCRLAEAASHADVAALAAEHATLFDGPVRCSPYEGAWGPQQLSGKAAQLADVAGFYAAFGLAPTTWNAQLEDHVAVECEFAALLAVKEAYALASGQGDARDVTRDAEAAFLRDHLGGWGPAFAAEVARQADSPLYNEAAALLAAWLRREIRRRGVTPVAVAGVAAAEDAPFACPLAPAEPGD